MTDYVVSKQIPITNVVGLSTALTDLDNKDKGQSNVLKGLKAQLERQRYALWIMTFLTSANMLVTALAVSR